MSFGPNVRGLYVESPEGRFILDPEDGFVSAALLRKGVYKDAEYKLMKSIVSKDSDVLIIGAHIGAHAVRISRDCRSLVAVEANPRSFGYLKANFLLNECSNVTAYGVAASDRAEKIRFLVNRENSGGSKRMPLTVHRAYVYDNPETIEVNALPLDALIGPKAFELILMDIEGSEYFALKGMQQILARSKTLSVEFLPHALKNVAAASAGDFLALLLPHFECMYVPGHNRTYPKAEMLGKLETIYQANEDHEGLLFVKGPLPDWLKQRQG